MFLGCGILVKVLLRNVILTFLTALIHFIFILFLHLYICTIPINQFLMER